MQIEKIHEIRLRAILTTLESNKSKIEVPVGCAIYNINEEHIVTEINSIETNIDPTSHAEILAIRKTAKSNSHPNLNGYTMYITLEPCLMCLGAILNSNIKKVIFGAYSELNIRNFLIIDQFRQVYPQIEFIGGVLEQECKNLISSWFKSIR